jgi:hypothetical protein
MVDGYKLDSVALASSLGGKNQSNDFPSLTSDGARQQVRYVTRLRTRARV